MGSNRSKLKKYNVVDLFCGAGGFSLGLKDTNRFNSILANDIDMDMCETYSLNFPKTKILTKSISDIDFFSIKLVCSVKANKNQSTSGLFSFQINVSF